MLFCKAGVIGGRLGAFFFTQVGLERAGGLASENYALETWTCPLTIWTTYANFRPLDDIRKRHNQNVERRWSSRADSLSGVDAPVESSLLHCRFAFCPKIPLGILCG